ncbi:polyprenyl synthetase family protein [Streptomyces sp. NPDC050636]|uniref:polyprenyl synthetase family protein n=1 Tax=Streptomyces sp. NPDC050636 TaxID=3154510 RepID=UPI00342FD7DC
MTPPGHHLAAAEHLRHEVDSALDAFLTGKEASTAPQEPSPADLIQAMRHLLAGGGKRLRPLLCACGWWAAGGDGLPPPVVQVAAALEMFHLAAMVHDDIIDASDTRRGRQTVHRWFTRKGTGPQFGANAAILVGDLALIWSDELVHTAGLHDDRMRTVLTLTGLMRTEALLGAYLELSASGHLDTDVDAALTVIRYKAAKYTVERPLHIGAALADAPHPLMEALTEFAIPLGEAFQLRDDLLGIYGDPDLTGKSNLDDLREGKRTALVALALRQASGSQAARLRSLIGNPALSEEEADEARTLMDTVGAIQGIEDMITDRYRQAIATLDRSPFPIPATTPLRRIAKAAVWRNR